MSQLPPLKIEHLTVAYRQHSDWVAVLRDVSLQVESGQIYGLVGESGSGKTTLALAAMGYLGESGKVVSGRIFLEGQDTLQFKAPELRDTWREQLALVPQNPSTALNPAMSIGEQVTESISHRLGLKWAEARRLSLDWLLKVGFSDPHRAYTSYPHQISGGMQQRVLIAMAMSAQPRLLVLDEPTTNLDATTQASILGLLDNLIHETGTAALYATHNMGVVAQMCDRVAVLYAGELVEDIDSEDLFRMPLHPYTAGLLDSLPSLGQHRRTDPIHAIPGSLPSPADLPRGCVFEPRCPLAIPECQERPPLSIADKRHRVRCWRWQEIAEGKIVAAFPGAEPVREPEMQPPGEPGDEALNIDQVSVWFTGQRTLEDRLRRKPAKKVRAVNGVSLVVPQATTIGLVGESGSGKTTLARSIVGLESRQAGEMELLHMPLPPRLSQRGLDTLRQLQMVFQNPQHALNPYQTVGEILRLPLQMLHGLSRDQAEREVQRLLESVHLSGYESRRPSQLSGGEVQRVALARVFAASPALLVADEPVSSLDVSVQAAVLNLLGDLQVQHGSAVLFISHNISVVGYLADQIAVMFAGRLVQVSAQEGFFHPPYHPYTAELLSSVPGSQPGKKPEASAPGSIEDALSQEPTGCEYFQRCKHRLEGTCDRVDPPWQVTTGGGWIYCHISPEELQAAQNELYRRDDGVERIHP